MLCCIPHSYGYAGSAAPPAKNYFSTVSRTDCDSSIGFAPYDKGESSYDKAALITSTSAVQFATLSAMVNGDILFVNWSTASEKNNKSFDIEASSDKMHFNTIGEIPSLDEDGNSSSALSYEFSADLAGVSFATSGIAVALLLLSSLAIALPRLIKWALGGVLLASLLSVLPGCQTINDESVADTVKAYIRIAQIDANGHKTYSKIVEVLKNN